MIPDVLKPKTNSSDCLWFLGSFEGDQIGCSVDEDSPLTERQIYDGLLEVPIRMSWLPQISISEIACGGLHTLALTSIGTVYSWGQNDDGALGREGSSTFVEIVALPCRAIHVSCGENHSLALLDNDRADVYYWGAFRNIEGTQLWPPVFTPKRVNDLHFRGKTIKMSSGLNHTLLLTLDNKLQYNAYGMGDDSIGRLSNARTTSQSTCQPASLHLKNVVDVWAVGSSSFYQTSFNNLYGWGYNLDYTLGLSHDISPIVKPTRIDFFDGMTVIDVRGGEYFALFFTSDHSVYGCGKNDCGQTGTDLPEVKNVIEPKKLKLPLNVVKIGSGTHTGFALTRTGKAFVWGDGSSFVLCNRSEENLYAPVQVDPNYIGQELIVDMAIAAQHSVIVTRQATDFKQTDKRKKSRSPTAKSGKRRVRSKL